MAEEIFIDNIYQEKHHNLEMANEVVKNGSRKRAHAKVDNTHITNMLFDHEAKIARLGELDNLAISLKQVQDRSNQFSDIIGHLQNEVHSYQTKKDRLAQEVQQTVSNESAKLSEQIQHQSNSISTLNDTVVKLQQDQCSETQAIKEQLETVANVEPKVAEVEKAAAEKIAQMTETFDEKLTQLTSQIENLTAELEAQKNRGFFSWIRSFFSRKPKPAPIEEPVAEAPAEEPVTEEPAEEEKPVEEVSSEEAPAEEPVAAEVTEEPTEEVVPENEPEEAATEETPMEQEAVTPQEPILIE